MKASKITEAEMEPLKIASLPTRPTAPSAFGGRGYTATEMKAAFDRLPCLIAERFNALIDDLTGTDIADVMPTGISGLATLSALYAGIEDGTLASKIRIGDVTLTAMLTEMQESIDRLAEASGVTLHGEDEA